MRRTTRWLCTVVVLLGALACSQDAAPTATSDADSGNATGPRYVVIPLGSLGGTLEPGEQHQRPRMGERALGPGGERDRPRDNLARAHPTDLGTLGGPNSAVLWPSKNVIGLVAGIAETISDSRSMRPIGAAASSSPLAPGRSVGAWSGSTGTSGPFPPWRQRLRHLGQRLPPDRRLGRDRSARPELHRAAEASVHRRALGCPARTTCGSCRRCPATRPAPPPASIIAARRSASPGPVASRWAASAPGAP